MRSHLIRCVVIAFIVACGASGGAEPTPSSVPPSAARAVATLPPTASAALTATAAPPTTSAPPTSTVSATATVAATVAAAAAAATVAAATNTPAPATVAPTPVPTIVATTAPPTSAPPSVAGTTINVTLTDTAIKLDRASVPSGTVTFAISNVGFVPHELIVLQTSISQDRIPLSTTNAKFVQTPGQVGATSTIAVGASATLTLTLPAGPYVLICNIESHYKDGMHTALTVSAP